MAEDFRIEPATVDQAAAALALLLGAVGSLLLIVWQSRCALRCRLGLSDTCYIFDCTRVVTESQMVRTNKHKKTRTDDTPPPSVFADMPTISLLEAVVTKDPRWHWLEAT